MVSKDQAIGGAILLVCVLVAVFYIITLFYPKWLVEIGLIGSSASLGSVQFWVIAVPVFVAFVAIMFIGAWIGWTMATTPPPKPIEEITTEIEDKKEEAKMTEPEPVKAPEAPSTEEKSAAKKKK
jgi:hypothetical protein